MTVEEKKAAIADIPKQIKDAEGEYSNGVQRYNKELGEELAVYESSYERTCDAAKKRTNANIANLRAEADSKIAGLRAREKNLRSQISEDNENTSKPGKGKKSAARAARN
jgi:capsule polysaccharide export protein KpsE/RkpR